MMVKQVLASLVFLFSWNAFAQLSTEQVFRDLEKVDQFDCDLEMRGHGTLRILTTANNKQTNRYVDLNLRGSGWDVRSSESGWVMRKTVDLGAEAIAPLFPRSMYGYQVTSLQYQAEKNGKAAELLVSHKSNTLVFGSEVTFKCKGNVHALLRKNEVCPNCLSSLGQK